MITVILTARDQEAELAFCHSALVPAATEGVVREVVLLDGGSRDGTRTVADAAGCTIREGSGGAALRSAALAARADWLLFLSAATVLEPAWQGEAAAFVDAALLTGVVERAATFRLGGMEAGWRFALDEWKANVATRLFSAPRAEQGLLISRGFYEALGGHRQRQADCERDLARRIGRRRLTLLRARALIQPKIGVSSMRGEASGAALPASDARRGAA